MSRLAGFAGRAGALVLGILSVFVAEAVWTSVDAAVPDAGLPLVQSTERLRQSLIDGGRPVSCEDMDCPGVAALEGPKEAHYRVTANSGSSVFWVEGRLDLGGDGAPIRVLGTAELPARRVSAWGLH